MCVRDFERAAEENSFSVESKDLADLCSWAAHTQNFMQKRGLMQVCPAFREVFKFFKANPNVHVMGSSYLQQVQQVHLKLLSQNYESAATGALKHILSAYRA